MKDLTTLQLKALRGLMEFIERNGNPPTTRQIQEMLKMKSPRSVTQILGYLEAKHYIILGNGTRNIKILRFPNGDTARLRFERLKPKDVLSLIRKHRLRNKCLSKY